MTKSRRLERINALLRNLVSSFIKLEIGGSEVVSVMKVEISNDLRMAKISLSVFPEKKEKEIFESLQEKLPHLYNYLKSQLKMKFLPNVYFEIDKGVKAERRIEEILDGQVAK